MTVKVEGVGHGGKREGAGRKKTGRRVGGPHRRRPELSPRHPVHVVLRLVRWMPELRRGPIYRVLHGVLKRYLGDEAFRIVHISIQDNHLHLLVEANDRLALRRGMQSFAINAARAINRVFRRKGKVFAFRYHATPITTARQARRSLAYVLNNWRKHRQDLTCMRALNAKVDPYSSGISFTGWRGRPTFVVPSGYEPLPVARARTALLASEWEHFGLVDVFEVPGPAAIWHW